ncbi:MAG: SMI1/KNR4 family protein [Eubacterium sp.]|nr:SMI1/KNR4 family protein [Eubacterium sp.]
MSALVDKIKEHPQIFHSMRCEMVRVWDCEDKLNLTFPEEFTQYLTHFGAIGFGTVEWTGMNVEADLNVVRATLAAREMWADFPADCFVLRPASEQGREMILCDTQENIYAWKPEGDPEAGKADEQFAEKMTKELICTGLAAYFELCLAEAKI